MYLTPYAFKFYSAFSVSFTRIKCFHWKWHSHAVNQILSRDIMILFRNVVDIAAQLRYVMLRGTNNN